MAEPLARCLNHAVEMQLLRVHDGDGRFLGHVFDLRCRWRPGQAEPPVVVEVVCGRRGLLRRLGFQRKDETLPWSAVRSIENGVMTVDLAHARRQRA